MPAEAIGEVIQPTSMNKLRANGEESKAALLHLNYIARRAAAFYFGHAHNHLPGEVIE